VDCGAIYFFAAGWCIQENGFINPQCLGAAFLLTGWIPVGCEIIDCCPECPSLDPMLIDWLVRVDGDPFEAIVLRFENLTPAMLKRLQIEGNAKWLEGFRLQIRGRGEVAIRGFSTSGAKDLRWSMLSPRMTLEQVMLGGGFKRPLRQTGQVIGHQRGAIRVRVEQKVGKFPISNSTLVFRYEQ
jgi:hypothetical protein